VSEVPLYMGFLSVRTYIRLRKAGGGWLGRRVTKLLRPLSRDGFLAFIRTTKHLLLRVLRLAQACAWTCLI